MGIDFRSRHIDKTKPCETELGSRVRMSGVSVQGTEDQGIKIEAGGGGGTAQELPQPLNPKPSALKPKNCAP